jgi:hypothetical protein
MPVRSLNALCGIDELLPELPELDDVVADVAELVELQAVTSAAAAATEPSAVMLFLHDAERKAPPWTQITFELHFTADPGGPANM